MSREYSPSISTFDVANLINMPLASVNGTTKLVLASLGRVKLSGLYDHKKGITDEEFLGAEVMDSLSFRVVKYSKTEIDLFFLDRELTFIVVACCKQLTVKEAKNVVSRIGLVSNFY